MDTTGNLRNLLNKKNKKYSLTDLKNTLHICDEKGLNSALIELLEADLPQLGYSISILKSAYLLPAFSYLNEIMDSLFIFDYCQFVKMLEVQKQRLEQLSLSLAEQENIGKIRKRITLICNEISTTMIHIKNYKDGNAYLNGKEDICQLVEYFIFEFKNYECMEEVIKNSPEIFSIETFNNNTLLKRLVDAFLEVAYTSMDKDKLLHFYQVLLFFMKHRNSKFTASYKKQMIQRLTLESKTISQLSCPETIKEQILFLVRQLNSQLSHTPVMENTVAELNKKYNIIENYESKSCDMPHHLVLPSREVLDYRHLYTFTIDKESTCCYEDALSVEILPNGNILYHIFITDANTVIGNNPALEEYAYQVGKNIHIPKEPVTIFPKEYTYHLCSLQSDQERFVIDHQFEFTPQYEKVGRRVVNAVIEIDDNFSYEDIDQSLAHMTDSHTVIALKHLLEITERLKENNQYKALYHAFKETKRKVEHIEFDSGIYKECIGASIVEESKILVNHDIASVFEQKKLPFIYRINEMDEAEKTMNMIRRQMHDNPNMESILNNLKKFYEESRYSAVNKGHYGLNLKAYAHASTPVRNYSAFINQRLIQQFEIDRRDSDALIAEWESKLPSIAEHLNERSVINRQYIKEYWSLYNPGKKNLDK